MTLLPSHLLSIMKLTFKESLSIQYSEMFYDFEIEALKKLFPEEKIDLANDLPDPEFEGIRQ